MKISRVTPILNVSDVPASLAWFESLGWERSFTWNDSGSIGRAADSNLHGPAIFAGLYSGDAEIFLCKDAQGSRAGFIPAGHRFDNTGGVWMSWWMESTAQVDELHAIAKNLGYDVPRAPSDESWGVREFHLRHPDGHTIRVSAGLHESR